MSTPSASPLSVPGPWDLVSAHYAEEVVAQFETYAQAALDAAGVGAKSSVVDVACGPGTLALLAARRGAQVEALDFSPRMVELLQEQLRREGVQGVAAVEGDGMQLPYSDAQFDAGFSMFGLMFFPDRAQGFRELHRVLRPGATAVVSSWAPLDQVPVLATTFGALTELTASPEQRAEPPRPMPLTEPDVCRAEMGAAGFAEVEVRQVVGRVPFATTDAFLDSALRTNAPLALTRQGLGERWPEIEASWRRAVHERIGEGPVDLEMTAHLIVGRR